MKSAKLMLNKVMKTSLLTFEELYSLLVQIESILNSRPLTPLSSDPTDLHPLCPAHFLIGRSLIALPEETLLNVPDNRLTCYQTLQKLKQVFWQRWTKEYLCELQKRNKWKSKAENLKLGQMVMLKDENAPPLQWKTGRITEVHPGIDGVVRVVTVRTPTGNFRRATTKVCTLPTNETKD